MADEIKTEAQLLTDFADNNTGEISEQDLRNFVVSVYDEVSKAGMEPAYGGLYAEDTYTLTIGSEETVNFTDAMPLSNVTSILADDSLTVELDGTYEVALEVSKQSGSGGGNLNLVIRKNGIRVEEFANPAIEIFGTGSTHVQINTILDLVNGDVIDTHWVDWSQSGGNRNIFRRSLIVKRIA